MQFLAIIRRRIESFSEAQFEQVQAAEAAAARAAYARGDFRAIHSRGDVPGAVIALEAVDVESAWSLIEALPFFQQGMIDVDVIPLRAYRAFV